MSLISKENLIKDFMKSEVEFRPSQIDEVLRLINKQTELDAEDIETIRIHLGAFKERLCNQGRWKEAQEYEDLIGRLLHENKEIIDPVDLVRDLAERIGIHQLYAITVDLRGEPAQKEGEWIYQDFGGYHCSECGHQAPFWCFASTQNLSNYCPNCGVKMKPKKITS